MEQIDREGTFRGKITEFGVATTRNGFPQFTTRLLATEMYDEEKGEWAEWDYDQGITAFLTLFGAKGETFHVEALERALGWDDGDFATLGTSDWVGKVIQFRVQESDNPDYPGLRVKSIDAYDADPVRALRTLDTSELKALNKQFVINRKKKPLAVTTKKGAAPAPATGTGKTPPPPKKSGKSKACTKLQAWEAVVEKRGEHSDDELAESWKAAFTKVCGNKDEGEATNAEWGKIRDEVLKDLDLIPF